MEMRLFSALLEVKVQLVILNFLCFEDLRIVRTESDNLLVFSQNLQYLRLNYEFVDINMTPVAQ